MKDRWIAGIAALVLGLLIAFGPVTLVPVCGAGGHSGMDMQMEDACETEDCEKDPCGTAECESGDCGGAPMVCHWTAQAELGAGGLIAVLGALLLLSGKEQVRLGLALAGIPAGLLAILIPNVLVGVCASPHAACHSLTLPALTVLGVLFTALAAAYAALLLRRDKNRG